MLDAKKLAELRDNHKKARRRYNAAIKARDAQETVHKAVISACEAITAAVVASCDPICFKDVLEVIAKQSDASAKALAVAEKAASAALREEGEAISAVTGFASEIRGAVIASHRARHEAGNSHEGAGEHGDA